VELDFAGNHVHHAVCKAEVWQISQTVAALQNEYLLRPVTWYVFRLGYNYLPPWVGESSELIVRLCSFNSGAAKRCYPRHDLHILVYADGLVSGTVVNSPIAV
jgi:hypothetical protein